VRRILPDAVITRQIGALLGEGAIPVQPLVLQVP